MNKYGFEVIQVNDQYQEFSLSNYDGIEFHHSATKDGSAKDYNAIKKYHVEVRGWRDIGYNVVIEKINGKVTILWGRPLGMSGAHDSNNGNNLTKVGVCVVGDFENGPFDYEFMDAIAVVIMELNKYLKKDLGIYYHHEFSSSPCPGKNFPSKRTIANHIFKGFYDKEETASNTDVALLVSSSEKVIEEFKSFVNAIVNLAQ